VLEFSYPAEFDPAVMGFDVGQVTAEWYSADGRFVVVYAGLDLNMSGPKCPGASIDLGGGNFQFIANAPTEGANCPLDLFPTIGAHPGVEAYECNGVLTFHTFVPVDQSGTLYGTLEIEHNNTWMGVTSTADNSAGEFPALDLNLMSC
jgi:hypothetical protein